MPIISNNSKLMNSYILSLFYLSNIFINKSASVSLLYSAESSDFNLETFSKVLSEYSNPFIILFKHSEKFMGSKEISNIFGVFISSNCSLFPQLICDNDIYIFSIIPKFKQIFPAKKENNFVGYLNYKENEKKGFGIGIAPNYKIWIDESIKNNSYISETDEIFEKDSIFDKKISKLQVIYFNSFI